MAQLTGRQKLSRGIVYGLTGYAFVNSYMHGVHWAQKWSPKDELSQNFAYGTAALPEALIVALVLRGRLDRRAVVIGAVSALWTMWVNGASAVGSASGYVVALAPPIAALLLLWLEAQPEEAPTGEAQAQVIVPAQETAQPVAQPEPVRPEPTPEPEPVEAQPVAQPEPEEAQAQETGSELVPWAEPEPVEKAHIVIEPVAAQSVVRLSSVPKAQPKKAQRGALADGVKWLRNAVELGQWSKGDSAQKLADELGVSLATAKRIRTEVFGPVRGSKTDKTDQEKSA